MSNISEAPEEQIESYLSIMLEGYETNLNGVSQYIEQTETQLNGAKAQKEEIVEKIKELKLLLNLEEEASNLELVKDAD